MITDHRPRIRETRWCTPEWFAPRRLNILELTILGLGLLIERILP